MFALALIATWVVACDPCSTTIGCSQAPTATLVGQLVDDSSGRPVAEATLEMRYVGGITLTPSVVTTRSSADGSFELSAAASAPGQSVVAITVAQNGEPPYFVPNFRIESSPVSGNATVLPPWVGSRPSIPVALTVEDQAGNQIPGAVSMVFRRVSGPQLFSGTTPINEVAGSTPGGYIFLFGGTFTDTVGEVAGRLFVQYAGGDTVVAASFSSTPVFRLRHSVIVVRGRAP